MRWFKQSDGNNINTYSISWQLEVIMSYRTLYKTLLTTLSSAGKDVLYFTVYWKRNKFLLTGHILKMSIALGG